MPETTLAPSSRRLWAYYGEAGPFVEYTTGDQLIAGWQPANSDVPSKRSWAALQFTLPTDFYKHLIRSVVLTCDNAGASVQDESVVEGGRTVVGIPANSTAFASQTVMTAPLGTHKRYIVDEVYDISADSLTPGPQVDAVIHTTVGSDHVDWSGGSYEVALDLTDAAKEAQTAGRFDSNLLQLIWRPLDALYPDIFPDGPPYEVLHRMFEVELIVEYLVLPEGLGDEHFWWCPTLDDDGNGTAQLNDLTGSENNGFLTSMDPATDWETVTAHGGTRALSFDGDNDQSVHDDVSIAAGDLTRVTLSYWMRRPLSSSVGPCFGIGDGTTSNRMEFQPWSDNFMYVTFSSTISGRISLDENWHHYVAVFDGTLTGNSERLKIYRDGVLQSPTYTGTIPATVSSTPVKALIGKSQPGSFGAGLVDDARIYTRALSLREVQHLATEAGVLGPPPVTIPPKMHYYRQMRRS